MAKKVLESILMGSILGLSIGAGVYYTNFCDMSRESNLPSKNERVHYRDSQEVIFQLDKDVIYYISSSALLLGLGVIYTTIRNKF